jgi:hypothetical protein
MRHSPLILALATSTSGQPRRRMVETGALMPACMKSFLLLFHLLLASVGYGQNRVWLIGTAHEATKYVTADTLLRALNRIQPDVILMELEAQHFTKDFQYDTVKYALKEYLVNNENRASYLYQQQRHIQLRPFDIEGRHEFYAKEQYREREQQLFAAMMKLYQGHQLSAACTTDFEVLLLALSSYSTLSFRSLQEANSDVTTKFLALKNTVDLDLILSIVQQTKALAEWQTFAALRKAYWTKRNAAMSANIVRYTRQFAGRRIVVLVGNEHRYILQKMLKEQKVEVNGYED